MDIFLWEKHILGKRIPISNWIQRTPFRHGWLILGHYPGQMLTRPSMWSKKQKLASGTKTFRFSWLKNIFKDLSSGDLRQPLSGQSKSNPESWHRGLGRFLQPVGTWQVLKQRISIIQMFYQDAQEGRGKVSIHLESVRTTHRYSMIASVYITNGNSTKARIPFFPHCMACWSSSPLEPRLQPGSGKSAPFPSSGEGSGDFCTGKWFPSLYETEEKCSGTFAVFRAGLGRQPARRNDSFRCKFLAATL